MKLNNTILLFNSINKFQ